MSLVEYPDILANAGGVVVSYMEMLQNISMEYWNEKKVHAKLYCYMQKASDEVRDFATENKLTLREAAFCKAVYRLNRAMVLRGWI